MWVYVSFSLFGPKRHKQQYQSNKDIIVWRSIHIHLYAKRSEPSLKKKKEIKFVKVDMYNVSYLSDRGKRETTPVQLACKTTTRQRTNFLPLTDTHGWFLSLRSSFDLNLVEMVQLTNQSWISRTSFRNSSSAMFKSIFSYYFCSNILKPVDSLSSYYSIYDILIYPS